MLPIDSNDYFIIYFSNGTNGIQDDYSPAQSLNKVSASSRGTRSSTTDFTSVIPTSNSNLSTNSSTTHNSSSLTIKSSKVIIYLNLRNCGLCMILITPIDKNFRFETMSYTLVLEMNS